MQFEVQMKHADTHAAVQLDYMLPNLEIIIKKYEMPNWTTQHAESNLSVSQRYFLFNSMWLDLEHKCVVLVKNLELNQFIIYCIKHERQYFVGISKQREENWTECDAQRSIFSRNSRRLDQ